ncbi:MAG: hypothetical protein ACE5EH_04325 [Gammaproteobacteria bacterium]
MNDLLSNPAFQSGVLPFIVALVALLVLKQAGWFWAGLAFSIAFFCSVYFAVGFQIQPLTSTRKIILLVAIATLAGLLADVFRGNRVLITWISGLLAAVAVAWVIWPVVRRQEGAELWIILLPSILYVAWTVSSVESLRIKSSSISMAILALGFGTGFSALLGASALLGQLGIAAGASASAYVMVRLFRGDFSLGSTFILPAALLIGLLGIAATIFAKLPWYVLVILSIIPLAIRLPVNAHLSEFRKILLLSSYVLPIAIIAVVVTWRITGAPVI